MSLQVWLPLTKDLRNQGLATITSTGTPVFKNIGKIGSKSLDLNTRINFNCAALANVQTFSIAFWAKTNQDNNITGDWMDVLGFTDISSSGSSGQLRWETCYTYGAPTRGVSAHDNATYATVQGPSGQASIKGNWNHFCITVDPLGTGRAVEYQDGVKIGDYAANGGHLTGSFWTGETNKVNGEIQDIRIYNHALSQMEVKEIAKGLVLHYPLNRQGWGQENLMPNSVEMPVGSSSNASTGTWRLAGSSQMTRSRIAITDSPVGSSAYGFQSVGLQTGQDASCWGIDGFPRENGTTYTLSAWGRIVDGSTTAAMLGFSVYSGTTLSYGGTYGSAASSESKYYGSNAYDYAGGQLNPNGSWTRIYRTFISTSTSDNIYIGFNTAKTGNNVTLQLCGVKLEKGDKMTSWIPNSNESMYTVLGLNGITEYDCSGFCNNSTRTGTFGWTSDTPKYGVSTKFDNNEIINTSFPIIQSQNHLTLTAWIKLNAYTNDRSMICLANQFYLTINNNGKLSGYCYGKSPSGYYDSNGTISLNNWTHIALTWDSSNVKFYINGILDKTLACTGTSDTTNYGFHIGRESTRRTVNGNISDVRIYATALSADDVKSLYQNSAYIDSSGNVYGAVHTEV